ncbi:MAG: site-specific integrase, partial [Chloroflexi bacterium]|nr:site-specific integrase [Chloroflexota bacterium]
LESIAQPRWKTIYIIAILMGLRKSEILGLRWQDIDFKNDTISINHIIYEIKGKIYEGTPKTERSRRAVAMPAVVKNALKEYQVITENYDGLVFTTSTGKPISQRNLTRNFHGALQKVGLPRIRFHDLRHTAATLLLKENVHPKIVQEMLGHSTITLTLDTYSHVIPGMQKEAASKMDSLFE